MSSKEHLHPDGVQSPENPSSAFNNPESQLDNMERKAIAELAYMFWEARGRPSGSSEEDWFRAEHHLRVSHEWSYKTETTARTGEQ